MRKNKSHTITTALTLTAVIALIITGCSGGSTLFRDPVPLAVEEVELPAEEAQENGTTEPEAEVHPIFTRELGVPISPYAAGTHLIRQALNQNLTPPHNQNPP